MMMMGVVVVVVVVVVAVQRCKFVTTGQDKKGS